MLQTYQTALEPAMIIASADPRTRAAAIRVQEERARAIKKAYRWFNPRKAK